MLELLDNKFVSNYLFVLLETNKNLSSDFDCLFNSLAGSKTNKLEKRFDKSKLKPEVKEAAHSIYKYLLLVYQNIEL